MDLQCHLRLPCPPFGLQASSAAKLPLSFRDLVVSQSRMTLSTSISSAWQLCSCWRGLSSSSTAQSWYLQLFSPYTPHCLLQDDPGIFAVVNRSAAVWAWGLSFSIAGIDQTSILQRCEWRVFDRGKNRNRDGEPKIWLAQSWSMFKLCRTDAFQWPSAGYKVPQTGHAIIFVKILERGCEWFRWCRRHSAASSHCSSHSSQFVGTRGYFWYSSIRWAWRMWMHWSVRTLGSSSRSPRRKLRGTLHLSYQTLRTEPYWFVCRHIPWVEALWSDCQVIFLVVLHDGIVLPLQLLGMQIYACLWPGFLVTNLAYFLTVLTFVRPAWGLMQWDGFLLWFGPSIWLCLPSFPMNVAGMQSRKTCRCPDRQRYDMIHMA